MEHRGDHEHDGPEPGKGGSHGAGGASPKRGAKGALPSSHDKVLSMLARLEKQVVDLQRQNDERLTGLAETAGEAAARGPAAPSGGRPADSKKKPEVKPPEPKKPDPKKKEAAATRTVAKPSPPPPPPPAPSPAAKSDAPWRAQHAAAAEAAPPARRSPPPPAPAKTVDDDEPEAEDELDADAEADLDDDSEADDEDGSGADLSARLAATRAQLQEAYLAIGVSPEAEAGAGAGAEVEEQDDSDESAEIDAGEDDEDDEESGDDEPADEVKAPRAPPPPPAPPATSPRGKAAAAAAAASADDDDEEVVEDVEVARLRQHVEKLKAAVEKRDQEIESFEQRLQKAQASAQGGGANKLVEAQRRQIERLTEQLTAAQGNEPVENDVVKDRDERIAVLEAELAEMRGENAPKTSGMGRVVGGLMGAIKGRKAQAGGAGEDGEGDDDLEQRLAQVESERDLLQQTVKEAMREAEDAKQQLREQIDAGDPEDEGRATVVESLQKEVERLKRELTEVKSQDKGAKADRAQKQITQAQALRDKAAAVTQARESLARTEKLLIKKWARQRAVVIQAYLLGIAVVCAGASLGAAHLFFPPRIAAVVDLRAKTPDGQRLTPEQAEAWARWHADLLKQASFHRTISKRLAADRQLDDYENVDVLAERLTADLTVDQQVPEILTLTLKGTDRKETIALLDVVGTGLERESSTQAGLRQDRAVASLVGEGRYENGRRYFASEGDILVKDRRNVAAAVLFVLMMGGSVLGIVRLNRWLLRTKSVMDEASTFFDSPQQAPLI